MIITLNHFGQKYDVNLDDFYADDSLLLVIKKIPGIEATQIGIVGNKHLFSHRCTVSQLLSSHQRNPVDVYRIVENTQLLINGIKTDINMQIMNSRKTLKETLHYLNIDAEFSNEIMFGDNPKRYRLDDHAYNFFPCPLRLELIPIETEKTVVISGPFTNPQSAVLKEYTNLGTKLSGSIENILNVIFEAQLVHGCYTFIFVGAPSWSGKTQLAFTLNSHSKYSLTFKNVLIDDELQRVSSERIRRSDSPPRQIGCVLHFVLFPSTDIDSQDIYTYPSIISKKLKAALIKDYATYRSFITEDIADEELLSLSKILTFSDFEYESLGIIYSILMSRLENHEVDLLKAEKLPYSSKSINQLKNFIFEKFEGFPVVVILDEFNSKASNQGYFESFFLRNILRLCWVVVMVMGTDTNASNQLDLKTLGGASRFENSHRPWVYIIDKLPFASPESLQKMMVLRSIEKLYFQSVANDSAKRVLHDKIRDLLSHNLPWREILTSLFCPKEILDWVLAVNEEGCFKHCTRPGIVIMFMANLIYHLSKDQKFHSIDILNQTLSKTKNALFNSKLQLKFPDEGHLYLYNSSRRLPFSGNGPKPAPSELIHKHFAYLLPPVDQVEDSNELVLCHNFLLWRYCGTGSEEKKSNNTNAIETQNQAKDGSSKIIKVFLTVSDTTKEFKLASYYPAFIDDELTNAILMIYSPLDNETKITMRELLKKYEAPNVTGLAWFNTAQLPKDGGEYLEALLHGAFVKASWSNGLTGLTIHQYIATLANELDRTGYSQSCKLMYWRHQNILKCVFEKKVPIFSPTDSSFSSSFQKILGLKLGSSFTVPDNTEVDGHAFSTSSNDVLFTLEAKGRLEPVGSTTITSIIEKAIQFPNKQKQRLGNRTFEWHIVFVLVDQLVKGFEAPDGLPQNVMIFRIELIKPGEYKLVLVKSTYVAKTSTSNPLIAILFPINDLSSPRLKFQKKKSNYLPSAPKEEPSGLCLPRSKLRKKRPLRSATHLESYLGNL